MSKKATNNELSPRQQIALASLALGATPAAAAVDAGVNRATVYRWLEQPTFQAALRALGQEALERTTRRLTAISETAALTLLDGMGTGQPIGARLRAAGLVLENAQKWMELVDIVARLEEIESEVRGESQ